jgi:hypothetical protein
MSPAYQKTPADLEQQLPVGTVCVRDFAAAGQAVILPSSHSLQGVGDDR